MVAQDQQRARSGLLAKRMGKQRIIARRGGPARVAAATACALLGLDCFVYMGLEDTKRQKAQRRAHGTAGATVIPVEAGTGHAEGCDERGDPRLVTNVESTHYIIGSAVALLRTRARADLQRIIGDEARAQILEQEAAATA